MSGCRSRDLRPQKVGDGVQWHSRAYAHRTSTRNRVGALSNCMLPDMRCVAGNVPDFYVRDKAPVRHLSRLRPFQLQFNLVRHKELGICGVEVLEVLFELQADPTCRNSGHCVYNSVQTVFSALGPIEYTNNDNTLDKAVLEEDNVWGMRLSVGFPVSL
ncbi:hypothetical protein M011DRAFT_468771, partial [Sporormia fimetaria CBS 119925]